MIKLYVEGIGLIAPGLPGWAASAPILAGREAYETKPAVVPPSELLPPAERRRAGLQVKIALAVGQEAFANAARDPGATPTVFSSSSGDGDNLHRMCESLTTAERDISPTRFHNSVHNAPAGYWSIAVGAREASTSLCGHDASFAVGLIDAATQAHAEGIAVALVTGDQPYPEPLHSVRPIAAPVGVAIILTPELTPRALAALEIDLVADDGACTRMQDESLEAMRLGVPAARAFPLLVALAGGESADVDIGYVGALKLRVGVRPC